METETKEKEKIIQTKEQKIKEKLEKETSELKKKQEMKIKKSEKQKKNLAENPNKNNFRNFLQSNFYLIYAPPSSNIIEKLKSFCNVNQGIPISRISDPFCSFVSDNNENKENIFHFYYYNRTEKHSDSLLTFIDNNFKERIAKKENIVLILDEILKKE